MVVSNTDVMEHLLRSNTTNPRQFLNMYISNNHLMNLYLFYRNIEQALRFLRTVISALDAAYMSLHTPEWNNMADLRKSPNMVRYTYLYGSTLQQQQLTPLYL